MFQNYLRYNFHIDYSIFANFLKILHQSKYLLFVKVTTNFLQICYRLKLKSLHLLMSQSQFINKLFELITNHNIYVFSRFLYLN